MSRALIQRAAIAALSLSTVGVACPLLAVPAFANPAGTGLVLSEAYVNGGSSGASYLNKFVELYNPTPSAVSLAGDTLQAVTLDARFAPSKPTPGYRARAFVQRFAAAPFQRTVVNGTPFEVHADDDLVSARGIATNDRLSHLAVLNAKHQFILAA